MRSPDAAATAARAAAPARDGARAPAAGVPAPAPAAGVPTPGPHAAAATRATPAGARAGRAWASVAATGAGLAVLAALLHAVGWRALAEHFARLGWGAIAILAGGLCEAACDALALREAARGAVGRARALGVSQAGTLANMVLPAEAGEILKAALLARDAPGRAATATAVWNVAFRLSKPVAVVAAAAIALAALPARVAQAATLLAIGFGALGGYAALRAALRRGWIGAAAAPIARLPGLRGPRAARLAERAAAVERETAAFAAVHPRRYLRVVLWQVAARAAALCTGWATLVLLGTGYPFALCALVYAGSQLATYALALLPTRVGAAEGATGLVFLWLGLDPAIGVVLQVIMRLKQIAVAAAGLPALARTGAARARRSRAGDAGPHPG